MPQRCNMKAHAEKVRNTRKLRPKVTRDLRPLFDHVIRLSLDSARRGYCQRAGRELRHARNLSTMK